MLDRPEMVEAFAAQLRRVLSDQADFVARIRRDAEAMWKANPPDGYSSFEAWWRHRWVTGPFAEIQDHLEEAAKLTFQLAARHRKQRHEIPAARQAAVQAKQEAATLSRGGPARRLGGGQPYPPPKRREEPPAGGDSFMDMIRGRSA
jgi:hypothetical protein